MAESDDEMEELLPPLPPTEEAGPSPEDEKLSSLDNPDVVTKYKEAAKIAQAALIDIAAKCVAGARIFELCKYGDETIEERCAQIFKNKDKKTGKIVMKGVAFPVCISVNECVCHCSPLESEADDTYPNLKEDDMVKIDMGVHVDGFIAVVAHTVIVGYDGAVAAKVESLSGRKNDVLNATYVAAEVASKLIRAGNTNQQVTQAIKQVAELYDVKPIAGTLMHQMKQYVVDGNKMILLKDEPEQKVEPCTFELLEVYAIDIAMSTGDGKPRESGNRTTVHKRAVEKKYSLKNKASRSFFNDVNKRFPTLPFSLRSMPDEKASKMGVRECVTHELLMAYPVLNEKKGDCIGHTKFTILLQPNGSVLTVTGLPPVSYVAPAEPVASVGLALVTKFAAENQGKIVPENILALLSQAAPEAKPKKDKKKK